MDVSRHALRFLHVVLTCQDGEWDGYEMYDMDAGSGDEGRRRAAFDDNIAAQVRGPVCPPAPSSAAQFACCPLEFRVRAVACVSSHRRIVTSCVSPAAAPSPSRDACACSAQACAVACAGEWRVTTWACRVEPRSLGLPRSAH
jgi:hypothetical protein